MKRFLSQSPRCRRTRYLPSAPTRSARGATSVLEAARSVSQLTSTQKQADQHLLLVIKRANTLL